MEALLIFSVAAFGNPIYIAIKSHYILLVL